MSHYSDYYVAEAVKRRKARKAELEVALEKLETLMFWNYETKYILPDSVRANMTNYVLIPIRAELYELREIEND